MDIKLLANFEKYMLLHGDSTLTGGTNSESLASIFTMFSSGTGSSAVSAEDIEKYIQMVEASNPNTSADNTSDSSITENIASFFGKIADIFTQGADAPQAETAKASAEATSTTSTTGANPFATQNTNNSNLSFIKDVDKNISDDDYNYMSTLFDSDKDGVISKEEAANAKKLLSAVDGKSDDLSSDDLNIFKKYVSGLKDSGLSDDEITKNLQELDGNSETLAIEDFQALTNMGIKPDEEMEATGAGSENSSSAGSSSSGGKTPASPAIANKTVQNMSIEDLEKEKETAKSATASAYQEYLNSAKQADPAVSAQLEAANANVAKTQTSLDESKAKVETLTSDKKGYESDLSSATSRASEIGGQISSLEAQKNDPEANISAINSQIQALKDEKAALENEKIPALNKSIEAAQKEIDKLNNTTIPALEQQLTSYKTQASQYQTKIDELAKSNPELQTKLDAYNKAVTYQDSIDQTLATRKADKERAEKVDMPARNENSRDYSDKATTDYTNMPLSYELDGKTYHCVGFQGSDRDGDGVADFKPDSWEEAQRYLANGGVANIGQYGNMQCHNYSNVLVDLSLGSANADLTGALIDETESSGYGDKDTAGLYGKQAQYNSRDCVPCKAKDRDAERAIIENELQNGRPCLVSVPLNGTGGTHWVTAVGMSDDGDILIWDSYNGSMEKLGRSSNSDGNSLHRNMASANGVMVFVEGASYQYSTAGYVNYWDDCIGQTVDYSLAMFKSHQRK